MDASPDVLADAVRAKRVAIDNDLEVLRVRLERADPRRRIDSARIAQTARTALPILAGTAAVWLWRSRRRRVGSLEQLLVHGLRELYDVEHQLLPALDRMRRLAHNEDLAAAFSRHHAETEVHVQRLQRVFRSIEARPKRISSDSVAAIISDGERLLARRVDRDVRDAWLIATAQRVEHFEIANYGTVRAHAQTLGLTYAAQLLEETLEEERATDEVLTRLAERFVNPQSVH